MTPQGIERLSTEGSPRRGNLLIKSQLLCQLSECATNGGDYAVSEINIARIFF